MLTIFNSSARYIRLWNLCYSMFLLLLKRVLFTITHPLQQFERDLFSALWTDFGVFVIQGITADLHAKTGDHLRFGLRFVFTDLHDILFACFL